MERIRAVLWLTLAVGILGNCSAGSSPDCRTVAKHWRLLVSGQPPWEKSIPAEEETAGLTICQELRDDERRCVLASKNETELKKCAAWDKQTAADIATLKEYSARLREEAARNKAQAPTD